MQQTNYIQMFFFPSYTMYFVFLIYVMVTVISFA